jgi:PAS domain-containing protein
MLRKTSRNEEKTMKVDENVFFREALRESEERHRITLKTAMDGFFRADMQGRILEVNETYAGSAIASRNS